MCVCVCVHVHLWVLVLRMYEARAIVTGIHQFSFSSLTVQQSAEFSRCLAVGGVSQISQISVSS